MVVQSRLGVILTGNIVKAHSVSAKIYPHIQKLLVFVLYLYLLQKIVGDAFQTFDNILRVTSI